MLYVALYAVWSNYAVINSAVKMAPATAVGLSTQQSTRRLAGRKARPLQKAGGIMEGRCPDETHCDSRLVAAIPAIALAQEPSGQGYGLGMKTCAQFANDYRASSRPDLIEDAYFGWAEGFMSGLNLSASANHLPSRQLGSINMGAAKVEIRSYCENHPLSQYVGAIVTIYNSLPPLR